ncbi:prepilin-type N-terminal cleavage/methylation domain-containing protein [Porticoccaceae bacterium]|nr:prepilin-type N-terminal cleavage/methylation domain-containing protein [Porticoccaceae bacterium]MDB2343767.1 prepilin-type N-terminal cleavage/methylation domain-containing protein [Porticoccaceae bacterium]MDB2664165.1 prepilin-type N-terminal cleavage/methylation domain-containing protein [Porticoccaceae bacterium]
MFPKRQQGFTLLEVLLAGFILFLTIATMTMVYRGALLSSSKAEQSLQMSAAVLPVRQIIADEVRKNSHLESVSGEGVFGDISYRWESSRTHIGLPSAILQEDSGLNDDLRYYLVQVDVYFQIESATRNYQFRELAW